MRLKSCFFCCSLKNGTIAIGVVSFLWAILSVLCAGSYMEDLDEFDEDLEPQQQFAVKVVSVGTLIYILVIAGISGLMIYGAQNRKYICVFPWLALATAHFMWSISVSVGIIILLPTIHGVEYFFLTLACVCLCLSLVVYVWLVVYSFYKELIIEEFGEAALMEKDEGPDPLKKVWYSV